MRIRKPEKPGMELSPMEKWRSNRFRPRYEPEDGEPEKPEQKMESWKTESQEPEKPEGRKTESC